MKQIIGKIGMNLKMKQVKQIRAHQVACLVYRENVKFNLDIRRYVLNTGPFVQNLCPEERFSNQSTLGFWTAFAVDESIVATAGHCINERNLKEFYVVFGFRMQSRNSMRTTLTLNEVYEPIEIIACEKDEEWRDYALIKVSGSIYQSWTNIHVWEGCPQIIDLFSLSSRHPKRSIVIWI